MSVTRPTTDSQVTLITCYPTYYIGPAPKRLVVFSKLANQAAPLSAQGQEEVTKAVPHLQPVSVGVR
jgi:sortase (surface protein transpeptidase)